MKELREQSYVKKVLAQKSPSNEDISNMFLEISKDIKSFVEVYDPNENDCPEISSDKLVLRDEEYTVPPEIMKAIYCIDPIHVDPVQAWEFYLGTGAEGIYLPSSLNLGEYFNFKKFENLLKEKTDFSDSQIEFYYNLFTISGRIILVEDYKDALIFHERVHKIISEELTDSEIDELIKSRKQFIKLLNRKSSLSFFGKNNIYSQKLVYPLISKEEFDTITLFGHWQELYAHMAQFEKYPSSQGRYNYIDEEIYELFSLEYPEAYQIYRKVYNLASD